MNDEVNDDVNGDVNRDVEQAGDLAGRAARGAAVTVIGLGARLTIQVGSVVVLARLLSPHDYGVVAMVLAIVGVGDLLRDFGLSAAAVQAPHLSNGQRNNLFWTNSAIGLLLGAVTFVAAAPIAAFYDTPALVPVTQALAGMFLLDGMMTQYRASLVRAMRFRAVAFVDVLSPAAALVAAIVFAVIGAGYWALVAQQLTGAAVGLVAFAIVGRWLPGRFDRKAPMRHLYSFGGYLLGSQLIGYLANNIDSMTIGHRFGPTPLGLYNRAFQLLMNPLNQVRAPSTTVALPVLSRAGTTPQFDRIVRAGQLTLAYPVAIGLAILIGIAHPTVEILLGDAWAQVPPILRLLAVAGIFQTLSYVGYWVYLARGLTRQLLQYSTVSAVIRITCVLVGSFWGVVGVAAGYAIAPMIAWPLSLWWLNRLTPFPVAALYRGAGRSLTIGAVAGLASAGAAWCLRDGSPWLQVAAGLLAGLGAAALLALAPPFRRDVATLRAAVTAALRRPRG
ncbi:lipopolysaccharide biosynthesis protein [Cellulomonas composti]|uniref:lipopolysaccharide biosynthesis protein n=1 Tax=Cellulomonas composti TaxID=266130 RepID=UPI001FE485A8|nr:lipopolysaccharide biosynthesis protein [Cellulomonas composti]